MGREARAGSSAQTLARQTSPEAEEQSDESSEESSSEEQPSWCRRVFCCATPRRRYRKRTRSLERETWDRFEQTKDLDFFSAIMIARDGGFSEVNQLWYPSRWVSAIFMVLFIVSNLFVIILADVKIIVGCMSLDDDTIFLNQPLINGFMRLFHIPGPFPLNGGGTICAIELLLLAMLVGSGLLYAFRAMTAEDEWSKWRAIERVSWKTLPELSTYSGMRLLHFASPSVLSADFFKFVTYSYSRWNCHPGLLVWKWTKFVVTRCLCFIIGLDSFLVKVHAAHANFVDKDGTIRVWMLYQLCMFLVQVLGIVQLYMFVKHRLFTFIFGGEDGILELHEKNIKSVWNAMLVREIWRQHSCLQFWVIMLSFSDTDFQKLVLNTRSSTEPLQQLSSAQGSCGGPQGTQPPPDEDASGSDELEDWLVDD